MDVVQHERPYAFLMEMSMQASVTRIVTKIISNPLEDVLIIGRKNDVKKYAVDGPWPNL